ncbi:P-loop containing nucleoside triphosphate hydrolase protein [Leucogyrophana mollusca]|uniref:P-loop containing nucleoside triphosphate hydrolase protein n=1 Tax=Leucogyrophana mollusca TaxID=85980 RepID=A0ACB8BFD6_9AGAM|nr:P-loop containing nucleoside triphosphate hydrolase protein [Leucogyrophana mollusca]
MRLQNLQPLLAPELICALEASGIKTDSDLLFSGSSVDILARLPPGVVSLTELKRCIALVEERASAPGIRADELLAREVAARDADEELMSGVTSLDELVGGFGGSRVFEISGEGGSGKSALALHIVLRHLVSHTNTRALWIDTVGAFSAEKTAQLLGQYHGGGAETALERLQVSFVFNIEAAHDTLEELRGTLTGHTSPDSEAKFCCVVIDTVTSLFAGTLSAVSSHGHAVMTTFMYHLRALAQTHALTFLVINGTSAAAPYNPSSAFASTVRKPALGPSFTFLTDCTLWLATCKGASTDEEDSIHVAEVFRSRTTRSKTWCTFKIRHGVLYCA